MFSCKQSGAHFSSRLLPQSGFALPFVIFVTAVLSLLLGELHWLSQLRLKTAAAAARAMRAQNAEQTRLSAALGSPDATLLQQGFARLVDDGPGAGKVLLQQSQTEALLALNRAANSIRPEWATWNSALQSGVQQQTKLEIQERRDQSLRYASSGKIELSEGLKFKDCNNLRVEIIAAGKIEIGALEIVDSSTLELLLHSATGEIKLPDHGALELCDPGNNASGALKLRAHAPGGLKISGAPKGTGILGCALTLDEVYWPRRTSLGKR